MDAATLADLLDCHAAALELYAAQWTAAPEDCVQEAFVELARQHPPPENPPAWLYRVVRNRALNALRASQRRAGHEQIAARLRAETKQQSSDPTDKLAVAEALTELTDEAREIVVLRLWSGLGWEEIAELTDTPSSTAHRHYTKALTQLRNYFVASDEKSNQGKSPCPN